jgi:hypothetical protein
MDGEGVGIAGDTDGSGAGDLVVNAGEARLGCGELLDRTGGDVTVSVSLDAEVVPLVLVESTELRLSKLSRVYDVDEDPLRRFINFLNWYLFRIYFSSSLSLSES